MPHPIRWSVACVTFLATAFAVVAIEISAVEEVLGKLRDSDSLPGQIRTVVAAGLFVAGLLALRRALYARLARKPGPVEIIQFVGPTTIRDAEGGERSGGGRSGDDTLPGEVLADFRKTLVATSLSAPQSVPNEPTAAGVFENVKTATDNTMNVVATIAGLLRAIFQVRYAYSVTGVLRVRPGAEPCGITVTVAMLPAGGSAIETIWAREWADVAERAAHFVAAFILPRSRLAKRPPWTSWHGIEVPPSLFHHAQRARHHVRERQYDKALAEFHSALKLDPQNPYLRIELAQAQEQVGLFLDALVAYADVVAVEAWYDRRLWMRLRRLFDDNDDFSGLPPPRWTRSPSGRSALLIARYRLVCRLAAGEELVDQLLRVDERGLNTRRATERGALRERIRSWFAPLAERYREGTPGFQLVDNLPERGSVSYVDQGDPQESRRRRQQLRLFVQHVAMSEAGQLIDDYRWSRLRRTRGMPVTQTALNILRVWAPLYRDVAAAEIDAAERPILLRNWPPSPVLLDRQLSKHLRRKPFRLREWQEYYNAACTLAVALGGWEKWQERADGSATGSGRRSEVQEEFARRAVRHLERGVSLADSGYVGRFAQWLATGDQDLNPLRATPQFVDFLDRYLPNEDVRVQRPVEMVTRIMSLHSVRLATFYARQRSEFWARQRVGSDSDDTTDDERGWEERAREILLDMAREHRDWRRRVALIKDAEGFTRRRGLGSFSSALPHLQDDPLVRSMGSQAPAFVDALAVSGEPVDRELEEAKRNRDQCWIQIVDIINGEGTVIPEGKDAALLLWGYWRKIANTLDEALSRPVQRSG